jgi:hypothetical protein
MKKTALLLFLIVAVATAQSQGEKINGNGNVTTKKIKTADYDKIMVAGFFDVELVSGNEGDISLEGEENLLEFIKIDVEGHTLKISVEKGKRINVSSGKKIVVTVPFTTLNEVSLSGSGDVNSKNTIKSTHFETTLTGSGDVNLDVDTDSLKANLTGSGDLRIKGRAGSLSCKVTGSGDFDAYDCKSSTVDASVSGSGNCKVTCDDNLTGRITGSGDINYKGDPKKKDTKVSGSGSISKA